MTSRFLFDPDTVCPRVTFRRILRQSHLNFDVRVPTSRQASELGDTASQSHRVLQTAARFGDVAQEAKHIKQIRLSRGVWTRDKNTVAKLNVYRLKISPISDRQVPDKHLDSRFWPRSFTMHGRLVVG